MKRIPLRADRDDASSVIGYVELKDAHEQTLAEHMATFGRMGVTGIVHVNGLTKGVECLCIAPTETTPLWNNQIRVQIPEDAITEKDYPHLFMNGDQKRLKPEVGQWWVNVVGDPPRVHKTGIVFFVGRDSKGRLLWEDCQGHIETDYNLDWSNWHHEPACTGWDWVPETFPQWYSYKTGLFESNNDPYLIRVDSDVKQAFVHRSGKIDRVNYPYKPQELIENVRSGSWKKLSQQEADEALHPKESFPQWLIPTETVLSESVKKPIAFYRRDSVHSGETFHTDGSSFKWSSWDSMSKVKSVSEKQAKERILLEQFPQWYISDKWEGTAYIKRIDAEKAVRVALDGKEKDEKPWSTHGKECLARGWYKQTTQDDAEARVTKKAKSEPEVATVLVHEILYSDDLNADVFVGKFVGQERVQFIRDNWKYVSVVSTKAVEVTL